MKIPASRASAARKGDSATKLPSSSSSARHKAPTAQRPSPTSNNFLMPVPTPGTRESSRERRPGKVRPRGFPLAARPLKKGHGRAATTESRFLRLRQQAVADARLGDQEARHHPVGFYFLPELAHQHPQILHIFDMGRAPDFFQQLLMRHHLAGMRDQKAQ